MVAGAGCSALPTESRSHGYPYQAPGAAELAFVAKHKRGASDPVHWTLAGAHSAAAAEAEWVPLAEADGMQRPRSAEPFRMPGFVSAASTPKRYGSALRWDGAGTVTAVHETEDCVTYDLALRAVARPDPHAPAAQGPPPKPVRRVLLREREGGGERERERASR